MSTTAENFIHGLAANIDTPDAHILKRTRGRPLEQAKTSEVLAYLNVRGAANETGHYYNENIGFMLAGIIYTYKKDYSLFGTVPFTTVLNRYYLKATDSARETVKAFIDTDIDEYGRFAKRFTYLYNLLKETPGFNQIDYLSLANDLEYWNDDMSIRIRWAREITRTSKTLD